MDPATDYVAARLGDAEPADAAGRWSAAGAETPALLRHIYLRVGDVMR